MIIDVLVCRSDGNQVLEQRETKKPDRGISKQRCQTLNQHGEVVCEQEMLIMYRR